MRSAATSCAANGASLAGDVLSAAHSGGASNGAASGVNGTPARTRDQAAAGALGAIAVIAPCPFPANHGTPGSIREIVQRQVELGYDVHVFTYPLSDDVPLEPAPKLHRVAMVGSSRAIRVGPMWRRPLWNLMIVWQICRLARKYRFQAIHAYNYEGALFGWLARLWLRKPLIFHHFNTMIDELPSYNFIRPQWVASLLARGLDYWAPRMSTRIIAISDPIEKFLLRQGIQPSRIVKIPMGVESRVFKNRDGSRVRQAYGLGKRPLVVYAGLLNRFQRLDILLEGMAEVVRRRPDARLMLVTNYIEPQDRRDCDELMGRLGLHEHVIITPPEPFERVPDYLAAADVCVVSRPDCPGVAVKMLNYMAAGRAIVVPAGSSMGLVHLQDVLIVPDHDATALGRGVLEILDNDALRVRLESHAPQTLEERFGLTTICDQIGGVYRDVLRGRGQQRSTERGMLQRKHSMRHLVAPPRLVGSEPKLRIGVLAACPFPANHGTPGSIREIAEAMAERGHDVRVVTYHIGQDIPLAGVILHRITPLTGESAVVVGPTLRRPLYDLQMVFQAVKVIRQHKIDIIHAHGYEAALAAWCCKRLTGVPVVYSGHNTMGDELPSYDFIRPRILAKGLARLLDVVVPRIGNRCVPHSSNIERFFQSLGLAKRTVPVVNFGIDIEHVSQGDGTAIRERYGLNGGPVILYAGVTDSFQRIDLLLEALKQLLFYEPEAKLLMVTTIHQPHHLKRVEAIAQRLGIAKHVVFTEVQPLTAIPNFLQACDVAVVPRPGASGFPIKLLNYMAARRPCVLFASSSSRLVHGRDAFLVSPDTSMALAEGLLQVLRDDELRRTLAEGGFEFVCTHHDRRATAQQLCATYMKLLGSTRRFRREGRPLVGLPQKTEAPAIGTPRPRRSLTAARSR